MRLSPRLSARFFGACGVLFVLVLVSVLPSVASAQEWINLGAPSRGLGGASVADPAGSAATYWNPGSLAGLADADPLGPPGSWDVTFQAGFDIFMTERFVQPADSISQATNFMDSIPGGMTTLQNYLLNPLDPTITATDFTNIVLPELRAAMATLGSLGGLNAPDVGVVTNAIAGVSTRIGSFGFSLTGTAMGAIAPAVDLSNLQISQAALGVYAQNLRDRGYAANPTTAAAIQLAADFQAIAGLTPSQANAMAAIFEEGAALYNVDLGDPAVRDAILTIVGNDGGGGVDIVDPGATGTELFVGNGSGVWIRVAALVEASFGYGIDLKEYFPDMFLDHLQVGLNLKGMFGRGTYRFTSGNEFGSLGSNFSSDVQTLMNSLSTFRIEALSFDLSVTAFLAQSRLAIAFSARNLTSPEIDITDSLGFPARFRMTPEVRFGIAFAAIPEWLDFHMDIDLTANNSSLLPGHTARQFGLGMEFRPWTGDWGGLALRLGTTVNMAVDQPIPLLTAGIGLRLWELQFDVSAGVNTGAFSKLFKGVPAFGKNFTASDVPTRLSLGLNLSVHMTW